MTVLESRREVLGMSGMAAIDVVRDWMESLIGPRDYKQSWISPDVGRQGPGYGPPIFRVAMRYGDDGQRIAATLTPALTTMIETFPTLDTLLITSMAADGYGPNILYNVATGRCQVISTQRWDDGKELVTDIDLTAALAYIAEEHPNRGGPDSDDD